MTLLACAPQDEDANDGGSNDASQRTSAAPLDQDNLPDVPNSAITNLHEMLSKLNIQQHHDDQNFGNEMTIAIFDNGYLGLEGALGYELPDNLYVEPAAEPGQAPTAHGTLMAKIIYAVATGQSQYDPSRPGPKLLLYNTNGLKNLRAAAQDVVQRGVDMVLYAQIWEYGGNLDGTGFINTIVQQVTKAGVLWINAAGNYGLASYDGPIRLRPDGNVELPHFGRYVRFQVESPLQQAKISLAWNDFTNDMNYRSAQDLDFILEDSLGQIVKAQGWRQDGRPDSKDVDGFTAHAREFMRVDLQAGEYRLQVKAVSKNFRPDSRLWMTANGPGIKFLERGEGNSVFVPANDPTVITVGAIDVDFSSERVDGQKPDIYSPSILSFSDGQDYAGTSVASAVTAGALAVYLGALAGQPHSYGEVKNFIKTQQICRMQDGKHRLLL